MRFFVRLSYKGTKFHGWQIQPNAISIQEELEKAFSTILQNKTAITGAGRTDTGVHAENYIAHFDMDNSLFDNDLDNLIYKLNAILPHDIAIHEINAVKENAHARFDAKSRTYQYIISKHKDAFNYELSWLRYGRLNLELMNKACKILIDNKDFTSFAKLHTDNKTNNCVIKTAFWKEDDKTIIFEITADRFLRNMVRSIVGTMVSIGLERISLSDFKNIIESKNRNNAGVSAPASGLFLKKIVYPKEIYLA